MQNMLDRLNKISQIFALLVGAACAIYSAYFITKEFKHLTDTVANGFEAGHVTISVHVHLPEGEKDGGGQSSDLNTLLKLLPPGTIPSAPTVTLKPMTSASAAPTRKLPPYFV